MIGKKPRVTVLTNPAAAAIKIAVVAMFFIFLLAGYRSQPTVHAALALDKAGANNQTAETETALGLNHFDAHCATCHGATGKGNTKLGKSLGAADLTSQKTQSKSDDELFRIIAKGKGSMPAFGKSHKPVEIRQTIAFLRRLPTLTNEERKKLESAVPENAPHRHRAHKPESDHHHDDQEGTEHKHDQSEVRTSEHPHEMEKSPAQPAPQHEMSKMQHQDEVAPVQNMPAVPTGPVMTLAEVEQMALQNNPTLAQAEAATSAAQGRRRQAGLWPNPVVGYQGEEFAFRAFSDKAEHFGFIEQTIPLGGKLRKSQRVAEQEVAQAEIEATTQKTRVLNTVRMLYYEALGAQQQVDLRTELTRIARDGAKTTSELLNVGQADRPDYLESEIEMHQVELELESARNNLRQVWQMLASVMGTPSMEPMRLAGNLEERIPALDQEKLMASLLRESPEIKRARAEIERAQAARARAKAERVPDLFLRGGIGYSSEFIESRTGPTGRRTGSEANVQVGITLPIFNRNQGGIAAAEAGITIAEQELTRLELSLRVRLAQAFRDYNNARDRARRYKEIIVPRAEQAYTLYLASFRQMSASYPQVLISQRTMFQ
ncbi:MAG: TolC family protein, partial [Pyrinomonadaceae bacterium]